MCGRFAANYTWKEIHAFTHTIGVTTPAADPTPSYNVAPTQLAWVLVPDKEQKLIASQFRWGLIPPWAKDTKMAFNSINARLETVATKPTFKTAWQRHRCLVPVSGYFEWVEASGRKQPYYIKSATGLMMLGGIFERWGTADNFIDSFSIVTTEARGAITAMHDRMPIILQPTELLDWVTGDAEKAMTLAMTFANPELTFYAVNPEVGNVRNNRPELIAPIAL